MKITLAAVTAITGLLAVETASAALHTYKATLNGAQENPPVTTAATGSATLTFDDAAGSKQIYGKITFTGLSGAVTLKHFHHDSAQVTGACGTNASTTITLPDPSGGEINIPENGGGNIKLSATEEANLVAGKMYINLHTAANGGGEIRGQLFKDGIGTCPAAAADAGVDSGASSSGGSSGTSSSGGTSGTSSSGGSSGGSSGATTERPDSGSDTAAAAADDDSGCSTSGASRSSANGVLVALGVGIALTGFARSRRKKR